MAQDVLGQGVGGLVAARAVFLNALHHDPVQVAADAPRQAGRVDLSPGGDAGKGIEAAEAQAGGGRLFLADDALNLGKGGAAQPAGVEGQGAGEQLVQQHAQAVDVAARVDVAGGRLGLLGAHVLGRADELAVLGEERLLSQAGAGRLGDAEVDDLRNRPAVGARDQHVRRLEVAVNHTLMVRMLHGLAHLPEQSQPLVDRKLVAIAVIRDRLAAHQLHHEIEPAGLGRARVEDPGDVRMLHQRQGLPLGLEARDHLPRVHAQLDDLQRHAPLHRRFLLGHEDRAETALADQLQQLVAPDDRAGALADRRACARTRRLLAARRRRRRRHESWRVLENRQQVFDLAPQPLVAAARAVQERGALPSRQLQRVVEDVLGRPGLVQHAPPEGSGSGGPLILLDQLGARRGRAAPGFSA